MKNRKPQKIKLKVGRAIFDPALGSELTKRKIFYEYPKGEPPLTGLFSFSEPSQGQRYEVKEGYLIPISEERAAEIERLESERDGEL